MTAAGVAAMVVLCSPAALAAAEGRGTPSIATAAGQWLALAASSGELSGDDWDWVDDGPSAGGDGRKSLLKAVLASALFPGLGERYVGRARRASYFHATEVTIWTAFTTFRIQGGHRRERYQEFARTRAGANEGGNNEYFEHIGLWLSIDEWHEIVRRDARLRFPDDSAAQEEFFQANQRYSRGFSWAWPDDDTRIRYRQLRSQSERSFRNGRLAVGLAIVNRLASMVDALALARGHNLDHEEASLDFRIAPRIAGEGLVIGPVVHARY